MKPGVRDTTENRLLRVASDFTALGTLLSLVEVNFMGHSFTIL
jgi:hypothetical protein